MAHKKAGSSSKNGRDSVGQRLGVKAGDGQFVEAGSIIVRQRGMTFLAGSGAGLGRDYTVFATVAGPVVCGSCRRTFEVGSTSPPIHADVCSACHPFFTGKQTIVDTAGQVERFQ